MWTVHYIATTVCSYAHNITTNNYKVISSQSFIFRRCQGNVIACSLNVGRHDGFSDLLLSKEAPETRSNIIICLYAIPTSELICLNLYIAHTVGRENGYPKPVREPTRQTFINLLKIFTTHTFCMCTYVSVHLS